MHPALCPISLLRNTLWGIPLPSELPPHSAPPAWSQEQPQPQCQAFSCFWSRTLESGGEARSTASLRRQGWAAEGGLSDIQECELPEGLCLERHSPAPNPAISSPLALPAHS